MIYFPDCKINIGLNVVEKRKDGFHNIETLLYPIPLEDVLEIRPKDIGKTEIVVTGLPIETKTSEDNLCIKAYNLMKEDFPNLPEVSIHLHKLIPMGAGLGGGSSDAAYTLKLIDFLFELNLSLEKLDGYARKLGADCAFFIYNVPSFAFNKGDELSPTTLSLRGKTILLVKPDIFISTAEAYAGIVPMRDEYNLMNIVESLPMSQWRNFIKNDFEKNIFAKHKEFQEIKDKLYEIGAIYAQMSGSGSTMYGIFDRELTENEINLFNYPFVYQKNLK
ncbi:MAG: 4-(cytidine 5'-diphospho)-2-C-methyl-D-erythritol kinase [Bacteroidales bacterium]